VAVTLSRPTGAVEEVHEPLPPLRVAVQRVEESMLKVTVPVGVPGPALGATDVE
jgi:hypothetical protein